MASYWFLCPPVCDVILMSVEADVEGVLCISNALLFALPAFDQVNHIPYHAVGCNTYIEDLVVSCTLNVG